MNRRFLAIVMALMVPTAIVAKPKHGLQPLQVTADGRFLQQSNGKPFYWQADTAWLMAQKLKREEIDAYFADRKAKGFNVVQTVVFQMLDDKNAYGDSAVINNNIGQLNITKGSDPTNSEQYDYWDHVDYIIDSAQRHGIYLAIAPVWSHTVRRAPITATQVTPYISQISKRWQSKSNIIWLNGGSAKGFENSDVWSAIGTTIKQNAPKQLITFHPFGRMQSSTWFQSSSWLDLNMFVSGHRRYSQDTEGKAYGEDNWRYVLDDLALSPKKPTIDGEPAYENTPQGLHSAKEPYWTGDDVRRYAYWSVFAGAAGHTYGENSVRQVFLPPETKPASGAKGYFKERLNEPGALSMYALQKLVLSRPYFERHNDQGALRQDEGRGYERVIISRGNSYLMAYTYTGRTFTLAMGRISGKTVVAWWFNPRTGQSQRLGQFSNEGEQSFDPPGEPLNGNDWVLVLDDSNKRYVPPAKPIN